MYIVYTYLALKSLSYILQKINKIMVLPYTKSSLTSSKCFRQV